VPGDARRLTDVGEAVSRLANRRAASPGGYVHGNVGIQPNTRALIRGGARNRSVEPVGDGARVAEVTEDLTLVNLCGPDSEPNVDLT
jgi:hypothetical protein